MSLTTDPNSPCLRKIEPGGQQKCYLVLSDEERAKGFVRPVRTSYIHAKCGTETRMGLAIAETYARNPKFYGGTFCCNCGTHFALVTADGPQFFWRDGEPVGSCPKVNVFINGKPFSIDAVLKGYEVKCAASSDIQYCLYRESPEGPKGDEVIADTDWVFAKDGDQFIVHPSGTF